MKITNNIGLELRAIQVDDYLVIVDLKAEIKYLDWYLYSDYLVIQRKLEKEGEVIQNDKSYVKITATIGKQIDKSIPVIKIMEQSIEDMFDAIDDSKIRYSTEESEFWYHYKIGVIDGLHYSQAKSSDKKYTEEDLKLAYDEGVKDKQKMFDDNERGIEGWKTFEHYKYQVLNRPIPPETIHLEFELDDRAYAEDILRRKKENSHRYYILKTTISTEEGSEIHIKI